MARTEDIHTGIWNEADFFALATNAKLIYIWTWTNPRCGMSGIYQVPPAAISLETGLAPEAVTTALEELTQAEFVFYDGRWLWCKARVKRIRTRTVEMCKSIAKDLSNAPADHPYREQLLELQGDVVWKSSRRTNGEKWTEETTIRDQLQYHANGSRVGQGYHTENPAAEPNGGPTGVVPPTHYGRGRGQGRGNGGRGAGKGVDVSRPPSSEAIALQEQHFPDFDYGAIDSVLAIIKTRRLPMTLAQVRALLYPNDEAVAA